MCVFFNNVCECNNLLSDNSTSAESLERHRLTHSAGVVYGLSAWSSTALKEVMISEDRIRHLDMEET